MAGKVDVTFTKWVTNTETFPWKMAGVVGGDAGAGSFAGAVLSHDTIAKGTVDVIHAHYHINGASQQLTADLLVVQSNQTNTAVSNGVVIDGWLEGAQVRGEYAVLAVCPIATPNNALGTMCFQGTLHITPGPAA